MKIWVRRHVSGSWEIVRDGVVIEYAQSRKLARARRLELLKAGGEGQN